MRVLRRVSVDGIHGVKAAWKEVVEGPPRGIRRGPSWPSKLRNAVRSQYKGRLLRLDETAGTMPVESIEVGSYWTPLRGAATGITFLFGVSVVTINHPAIRRGKDVTQQSESQTDFGGVVGAGLHCPIGGSLGLRLDAEDYTF